MGGVAVIVVLIVLLGGFIVLLSCAAFVALGLIAAIWGFVRKIITTTWHGPAYEFPPAIARCRRCGSGTVWCLSCPGAEPKER